MSAPPPPFGELRFLYLGTADFARDLKYYREVLGAERVWEFSRFGAQVAALRLGGGPLLLLADHRPAPSCLPIFAVPDLEATAQELRGRGWQPDGGRLEIPNGPCYVFHDRSGNPFAFFQDVRPGALDRAYVDPQNRNAVHD